MNAKILVLRLSRRAVAAAALSEDTLMLCDGVHLRPHRERAVQGLRRYVEKLLDIMQPVSVVVDAPKKRGSQTDALLEMLRQTTLERHVTLTEVSSPSILTAFGLPPLESRRQLRSVAEPLFDELTACRGAIKPYVVDAAASALVMESAMSLGNESP